jgi:hypothetical protein
VPRSAHSIAVVPLFYFPSFLSQVPAPMTGVKTRRNSPAAGCVPCRLSGWIVGSRTRYMWPGRRGATLPLPPRLHSALDRRAWRRVRVRVRVRVRHHLLSCAGRLTPAAVLGAGRERQQPRRPTWRPQVGRWDAGTLRTARRSSGSGRASCLQPPPAQVLLPRWGTRRTLRILSRWKCVQARPSKRPRALRGLPLRATPLRTAQDGGARCCCFRRQGQRTG